MAQYVLIIDESSANLDWVTIAFIPVVTVQPPENCTSNISTADRVIGISLNRSIIRITQSWFEGINVGLGGVIYDEFGSDLTIINTTFVNNSASDLCVYGFRCNSTSGIVYANSHRSNVSIYESKFVQNVGVVIFGDNCNILITHTKFVNNKYSGFFATVYTSDTNLVISHSTFTDNTGQILDARHTNTSISHSVFISNNESTLMYALNGMITSINHSKFINNTSILRARNTSVSISHSKFVGNNGFTSINRSKFINNNGSSILRLVDTKMISIAHSEFVDNTVTDSLIHIDGVIITVYLSEFINNRAIRAVVYIPYYTTVENLTNNVFIDSSAAYEVLISSDC